MTGWTLEAVFSPVVLVAGSRIPSGSGYGVDTASGAAATFPAAAPASSMGQILAGIFLTIMVCMLAYATTRFLARRLGGQQASASRAPRPGQPFSFNRQPRRPGRLEIVERLGIGRDRQIMIVRAGDQHFLASVSAGSIQFGPLITLAPSAAAHDADEPAGQTEPQPNPTTFADVLNAIK